MNTYSVTYERGQNGWWIARVPAVPGCHTQGRSIDQARRRIREALRLWGDDADKATLIDDVRLPAEVRAALTRYQSARRQAEQEHARAQELAARAVHTLTGERGLSVRNAGALLGRLHQRVQQLVSHGRHTLDSVRTP